MDFEMMHSYLPTAPWYSVKQDGMITSNFCQKTKWPGVQRKTAVSSPLDEYREKGFTCLPALPSTAVAYIAPWQNAIGALPN